MKTYIISIILLTSSLLSDEMSQLRQIDTNEKNLLKLFAKENSKAKNSSPKEEIKTPDANSTKSKPKN